MLKLFLSKGARVDNPPDKVSKMSSDPKKLSENYRKSPFIIQAACSGDIYCFKTLLTQGCKITEQGFICLSPKKKNQVITNVIGAAAYYGSQELLKMTFSYLN